MSDALYFSKNLAIYSAILTFKSFKKGIIPKQNAPKTLKSKCAKASCSAVSVLKRPASKAVNVVPMLAPVINTKDLEIFTL